VVRHWTRAYLGLGSNLGNRKAFLEGAIIELDRPGIYVLRKSSVLETEPVGVTDQPAFLNQVVEIETSLPPRELLQHIKGIERGLGRQARVRWGPREIDIDILKYGEQVVEENDLRIPHPEIANRPFLGKLLAELGAA
jgi:2-amino-4-hydroxy-6-hydroxymethyldihydropteridine diphosphokinase